MPRRQLTDDSAIMDFLLSSYVDKFDMYVEDQCPAYVRYCFTDPMDAAIFRSRFKLRAERLRLVG
jgi:L-lysine 2,3-aminomutase